MSSEPARSANIFDVARLAGVSHQTVSRVINEHPSVRPATRTRVQEAIKQLRYTPSQAARALVTRRTRMIGLVTAMTADFGPASIALHFNEAARAERYPVVTTTPDDASPASLRNALESLIRQNVEAIVILASSMASADMLGMIEVGVPVIMVKAGPTADELTVSIDQYHGAREAVRHLVDLAFTDIRHLAGPASPDAVERTRGWRDELAASGLVVKDPLLGDWTPGSGYQTGSQMLVSPGRTAVFVGNDLMALGLIAGLHSRGLRVPEDVSVVGFDDIPEAAYFAPPLTTIKQDFVTLGQLTMTKVLEALDTGGDVTVLDPIRPTLIIRASTRHSH